jgi:vitamin B12 transporter
MPSATFADGEELIRRPKHAAELVLRGAVARRVTLGGSASYIGARQDVDFNQFPSQRVTLPSYIVVDLAAELELLRGGGARPQVSATIRAENLFNERYDEVVGFAGRPRGIFGGARVHF